MRRFAALHCYDNVRPDRLPLALRDGIPTGECGGSPHGQDKGVAI